MELAEIPRVAWTGDVMCGESHFHAFLVPGASSALAGIQPVESETVSRKISVKNGIADALVVDIARNRTDDPGRSV